MLKEVHRFLVFLRFSFLFKGVIYLFLERREGREKEERNIHVQEKHQSVASLMPSTGDLAS